MSSIFPPAAIRARAVALSLLFAICGGSSAAPGRAEARPPHSLVVRYPGEGAHIAAVSRSFIFGSAPPGATVAVNGVAALVAADGAWIAFVPFAPGRFILHVRAESNGSTIADVDRSVYVDRLAVQAYPTQQTIVQPGDPLPLAVLAVDGARVTATGPGFAGVALAPAPALGSAAFGATIAAPNRAAGAASVRYRIVAPDGSESVVSSSGTLEITTDRVVFVGKVVSYSPDPPSGWRPYGMLGPTPDAPTEFTAPIGTPFEVTGRAGDALRVSTGGDTAAWIDRRELAPDHSAHSVPAAALLSENIRTSAGLTTYVLQLAHRIPIRIDESTNDASLRVSLYGSHVVRIAPPQRVLWGYRVRWAGNDLEIAVRKPPRMAAPPLAALAGLRIVVDPGHAPDTGAIGPLDTIERDINLDISLRLAAKLRALGAWVVMTRTDATGVPLYDRPALAERIGADVLVSVHNNAWPDGVDPSKSHGYSVYFFQPQSLALARAIHAAYARDTDLPDEGLYKGDLALVRTSALPSVLTESAFITWPPEEMKLRDSGFRDRLAAAMADGMERWAEDVRSRL